MSRLARIVAVAASAVLGIAGGAGAAVLMDDGQSRAPTRCDLDVAMVDQSVHR